MALPQELQIVTDSYHQLSLPTMLRLLVSYQAGDLLLRNGCQPKTEVRASALHGRGVFATRDIEAGEFITMCPIHAITETGKSSPCLLSAELNEIQYHANRDVMQDYAFVVQEMGLTLSACPNLALHPFYHGHLINDALTLRQEPEDYEQQSLAKSNAVVMMDDCSISHNATHFIAHGTEIVCCYGAQYWHNKYTKHI